MDYDYDVVIIGAGPVGGYASRLLCERGLSVLMIEEHTEIGRPFQCAGLVTPSAMHAVEAYGTVVQDVDGALIHGPSGTLVPVGRDGDLRTYVVCRKRFDQEVVQQGLKAGADILLESQPTNAVIHSDGVIVSIKNQRTQEERDVSCKLFIGCDGAHSWVRRTFKMGRPKEMMIGFQSEVVGYEGKNRWLEMYSGSEIAPGFFAWAIPSGETTRIGMWSKAELLTDISCEMLISNLMNDSMWKNRFENCTIIGRFGGPVPSGLIKYPLKERVALFGDASGACKPTTGGGISTGFDQVDILAPKLSESIVSGDLTEERMRTIGKSLEPMRKKLERIRALRNAFLTKATDNELDDVFEIWSRPDVTEIINQSGEIDNPIPLGLRLLKEVPEFRSLATKAASAVIWG